MYVHTYAVNVLLLVILLYINNFYINRIRSTEFDNLMNILNIVLVNLDRNKVNILFKGVYSGVAQ